MTRTRSSGYFSLNLHGEQGAVGGLLVWISGLPRE